MTILVKSSNQSSEDGRRLKYSDTQPRDNHGRFADGGGGASSQDDASEFYSTPDHAVNTIAAGKPALVSARQVRDVLALAKTRTDHPDLANLTVEHTHVFAGGMNIPRDQMPQIPDALREDFIASLKTQGISTSQETVSPSSLYPTQNQIDATKVGGMLAAYDKGTLNVQPILVSQDDRVLDGHHRWAALTAADVSTPAKGDIKMPIVRIHAGHQKALDVMLDYAHAHGVENKPYGKTLRPWYRQ